MTAVVLYAGIGLGPDEAQYWTWSQKLSFGYYSKPPGIAWQIWLSTLIFGNSELGVRFGSLLIGSVLPFIVYFVAIRGGLTFLVAFLSALLMALTPIGFLSTFFAITDVGQVLFWTLALVPLIKSLKNGEEPNYHVLGLLIGLGALFKWQIYFLWVFILILSIFFSFFRRKTLFSGLLISLIGLLPSLVWNMQHDFPTFRHVFSTLKGAEEHAGNGNVIDFIGAQIALLSPIIFFMLLFSFIYLHKTNRQMQFLGYSTLLVLTIYAFYACFKKVQGNWCDYIYPASFIYLAYISQAKMRYGLQILLSGVGLSLVLVFALFSLPTLQQKGLLAPSSIKINPFKHNLGWDHLAQVLKEAGYEDSKDFLFSDSYQITSILSFYGPSQKRAYFFNLNQIRKNQFSYWPGMEQEQVGKKGFFVLVESGADVEGKLKEKSSVYLKLLQPYFQRIEAKKIAPLFSSYGNVVKAALILQCEGYNGLSPHVSSSRY